MRVLHLIDAGSPILREFARPRFDVGLDDRVLACRELCLDARHEHRTCFVGPHAAAKRANSLGLSFEHVVSPLLGRPKLAVKSIGQIIRAIRPDLVHWWNDSWTAGCVGRPGRAWRLESVLGTTPMRLPLWLSRAAALTCGPAERASAAALALSIREVSPPVFVSDARPTRAVQPIGARILLLGPGADARRFLYLCGLLGCIGLRVCAVIPVAANSLSRTRRFRHVLDQGIDVDISSAPRSELIRTCDAAVWMGGPRGPSPIAIGSAVAAGVPVIVPPEAAWAVPEPLHEMLVARNSTPNELARVVQLHFADVDQIERRMDACRPNPGAVNARFVESVYAAYDDEPQPAALVAATAG